MSKKTENGIAVIMAGGKGIRMKPLTDSIPKPLLPIGTKPILEVIIRKLKNDGFNKLVITTGYKGEMIESYFGDGTKYGVAIKYTKENKPLGTVGALTLIPWEIKGPFLVINGDVLTDQDLKMLMNSHLASGALITVGITKHQQKISFGVVNRTGSILREIEEKPELYFDIGAGIYVISPEVLKQIPQDTFFDFPDLVKKIKEHDKITCFEIKGLWKDIGRKNDYEEINQDVELLKSFGCYSHPSTKNNLSACVKVPIAMPNLSVEEARACFNVVLSGWLHEGDKVKEFEDRVKDYIGCKHAVAFFNGTVALHTVLAALGIGPGDEVIVPGLTFVSTATTVLHVRAKPVFADIDPHTFTMDPADTELRINEKTKAIILVHYGGQSADVEPFVRLAEKYNLFLIEDVAEALGAEYESKRAGSFGIAGMFSFTPTKNITTGEGGIITTDDSGLAHKLRLLKNHGASKQYCHFMVGYNYRMTEMQGAIGVEQMKKLPEIIKRKQELATYFSEKLQRISGIVPPLPGPRRNHTYMMFTVKIDPRKCPVKRAEIINGLQAMGIQTKIYFPPLHKQPIFEKHYRPIPPLSVTDSLADKILSLPIHSKLEFWQIDYIVESLQNIIKENVRVQI